VDASATEELGYEREAEMRVLKEGLVKGEEQGWEVALKGWEGSYIKQSVHGGATGPPKSIIPLSWCIEGTV
jgi:hypothetical protein